MVFAGLGAMTLVAAGCRGLGAAEAKPSTQPVTAASVQPVYAVPRLDGMVVDGRADDWGTRGFRVDAMIDTGSGRVRPAANFDPRFRLAWNQQGLLVLVEVTDDMPDESNDEKTLYERDSVELFVATKQGGPRLVQVIAAPGTDPQHRDLRYRVSEHRANEAVKVQELPSTAVPLVRTATPHGYILEALLPWANLGLTPQTGDEITFQIFLNDADGGGRTKVMWYPVDGVPWSVEYMHRLRLDEAAAPAHTACRLWRGRAFPPHPYRRGGGGRSRRPHGGSD